MNIIKLTKNKQSIYNKIISWFNFPRALISRLLLILFSSFILLQIISTSIFIDNHWKKVNSKLGNIATSQVTEIVEFLKNTDSSNKKWLESVTSKLHIELQIIPIKDAKITPTNDLPFFILDGYYNSLKRIYPNNSYVIYNDKTNTITTLIIDDDRIFKIVFPRSLIYSNSEFSFLAWLLLSSLILTIITGFFMHNQIRPLKSLAIGMEKFGKKQELQIVRPSGSEEIISVINSFNKMQIKIIDFVEQRSMLLAGISHDLRTPLTRMKLELAMIENEDLKDLKQDINDMEMLLNSYLEYIRSHDELNIKIQEVDISKLIEDIISKHRNTKVSTNVQITFEQKETPLIKTSKVKLYRIIQNLLDNAIRYGKGTIIIRLFTEEVNNSKTINLSIEDNGKGVNKIEKNNIFKAFYRTETSRNAKTGGVGLGLTIVKELSEDLGANIALEDSEQLGGLKVTLSIEI